MHQSSVRSIRVGPRMMAAALTVAVAAGPGDLRALAQPAGQSVIEDARRLIEAFEYDQVVALLDTEIVTMAASPEPDTDALAQAYELRGRAHFNLSRREEAGRDFGLLMLSMPRVSSSGSSGC